MGGIFPHDNHPTSVYKCPNVLTDRFWIDQTNVEKCQANHPTSSRQWSVVSPRSLPDSLWRLPTLTEQCWRNVNESKALDPTKIWDALRVVSAVASDFLHQTSDFLNYGKSENLKRPQNEIHTHRRNGRQRSNQLFFNFVNKANMKTHDLEICGDLWIINE